VTSVLFVSDIHLSPESVDRQKTFLLFLECHKDAEAIYFLGDVFDYWIGPKHLDLPDYQLVLEGLRRLTQKGLSLYFIPGNRDYFVDKSFTKKTGVKNVGEAVTLDLNGHRVHLCHGDFLYNRNPKYSAYRRMMRFSILQKAYLSLPPSWGTGLAKGFRKVSVKTTPQTTWGREDLIQGAMPYFEQGVEVLICGHIHIPFHIEVGSHQLFVLGDWGARGEYVHFDGKTFSLKKPAGL